MALILNIETATTVCSVSLAKDGKLLSLKEQNGDYSHAENLTLFIEDVCKQANINLSQVDAIAISKGPGSYTGLRIGVSTAKGLCYSLDKPLISISTLLSITQSIVQSSKFKVGRADFFCPMEVYCSIYDFQGNVIKETAAEIIDEHSFADILKTNKVIFFGDGASKCKETFSNNANAVFIDDIVPSAKDMIMLSEKAYNAKQFEDVAYFEPYYLKDFVAGKKKGE
jgi:tRNA threonylcarbamoyladenosine biosynthesis protein TsaB